MVCREGGWEAIFAANFTLAPHIKDELRNGEQHAPHIEDELQNEEQHAPHIEDEPWNWEQHAPHIKEEPQNEEQHTPHIEDEPWNVEQHAPHYEDEIAGLQKRPFLAGFWLFWMQFFLHATHLYGQTVYILQKNCLQMSFPGSKHFNTP